MAGENDILHYVNGNAIKNFNQILGTFEDSVDPHSSDPHFTVNSNDDSHYVAIDSVNSIIPQKTDDTFAVLSLNIQSNAAKFDSFLSFLSYLDENNIHFNAICLQDKYDCLTKVMRRYTTSLVISSYTKGNRAASMAD